MKITFLIRALNLGGAQSQMVLLARELQRRGHTVEVITFYEGVHAQSLTASGITIHTLHKRGRWDMMGFLWRLATLVRKQSPDILYGYLAVCNLLTSLLRGVVPKAKSVWGVRTANLNLKEYDWLSRSLGWLEVKLSRLTSLIIVNSQAGEHHLVRQGVPAQHIRVIPNGIDTELFYPAPEARAAMRSKWNIAENEILIGIVGRIDPVKGHHVFLRAAQQFSQLYPVARFICVGEVVNSAYQTELHRLTAELGLQERVIWPGAQYDMLSAYNALDILTNASSSEGFANVIGEAMACGVPCVVTDVGDSALIVGETGVVVPANDAAALVAGWVRCLRQRCPQTPDATRQQIAETFSVHEMTTRTEAALMALV